MEAAQSNIRALVDGRFVTRLCAAVATLVLLSVAISLGGKWLGRSIVLAGHSDDPSLQEIVIGNNVLAIPANAIRFEDARRDGVTDRLDLYLHWPDLEGYSDQRREAFNNGDADRSIVFLTIAEASMSRDMTGRFEPIYRKLLNANGRRVTPELAAYRFTEASGYRDEELVVGTGQNPFVARCLSAEAATTSLAPCERDLRIGEELSLTYRFPRAMLTHAAALDAKIRSRAQAWLRTAQ